MIEALRAAQHVSPDSVSDDSRISVSSVVSHRGPGCPKLIVDKNWLYHTLSMSSTTAVASVTKVWFQTELNSVRTETEPHGLVPVWSFLRTEPCGSVFGSRICEPREPF